MKPTNLSQGPSVDFESIETLLNQGKTVISAEDSAIIELALKITEEGKTATFYLKDTLFTEVIRRRVATSDGAAATGDLEPLSSEEAARIKADFEIELDGASTKEICPRCKSIYGTYEFIQQGVKEHGKDAVKAVFSLKGVSVLQIHPRQNTTCQTCGFVFAFAHRLNVKMGPHGYVYRSHNHGYGCCR
ncbi:MAG: hypothetical protein ABIS36_24340 [Chryseolinea sp.]